MSDTQGNSEIPLPTIRAPLNPDVAPAEDQDTVAPLPTLRGPTLSSMDTSVAPLPTLRAARAATPVAFEPEDENAIVLRETPYEAPGAQAVTQPEENERIQNPVVQPDTQATQGNSPFIAPSTERSMVGQTMRSFETRTGTTQASNTRSKTNNLGRTSSSSTVVVFDEIAPSDLEIYDQAGLVPPSKNEKVADHRIRIDENMLRVSTNIVAIRRRIDQLEAMVSARFKEVILRVQDLNSSPATAGVIPPAVTADIERVKSLTMEGRTAITNLTLAMDPLVDLPREVERLSRTVLNLTTGSRNAAGSSAHATVTQKNSTETEASRTNLKRDHPYAGFEAPEPAKRQKAFSNFSDVYLYDVNTAVDSPGTIARKALERLGMSMNDVLSVQHPRNTPRTVISIRFRDAELGDEFMDRIRANPPASMARLHAVKPAVYEKRATANNEKDPCLRIIIWNVNGRLAVKITHPDFVRLINDNDVIIFQETFLRDGEERTLSLPPGFEIVAMSRPDVPGMKSAWGGVAAVIRTTVPFKLMTHLCAPDLIVLDLHHLFLVGAYLLPGASAWREWTKVDPQIKLTEVITTLSIHLDKPLLTGGDLNARIGERIPSGALLARTSSDPIINTRGRWLLRLCSDTSMTILNGTTKESVGRGAFTSFQPLGSSVIDYCFVSSGLIPRIAEGAMRVVKSPVWSDHAQIQLTVVKPESRWGLETPVRTRQIAPILFNNPTPLDLLLKATLEACVSSEEATARLYGPVFDSSDPISVYVGSSSRNGHSAFALWYGPQCKRNCAFTLEDSTEARAGIMAVLCAARDCPRNQDLVIYMTSQYIIRAFCYWAGDNETRGWTCANGDDLCDAVGWLALRRATVKFRWVSAHVSPPNAALRYAKNAAKRALAGEALAFDYLPPPDPAWNGEIPRADIRKVSTTLREAAEPKAVVLPEIDVEEVIDPDLIHRGRKREREMMHNNLLKLLSCTVKSSKEFWGLVRGWTDDRPFKPRVTIDQLHDSFKARLNPPAEIPDSFDADLHEIVTSLNASIPKHTQDRTPQGFFSRKVTVKDMQRMKKKLRKKISRRSTGIDEVTIAKIMTIPNEALVQLYQTCADELDAPQQWLVILLIGILKQGKPVDDPESYRLVGMEAGLLQMWTMILDERVCEWAEATNFIPDSQNGFRPNRRTDDNSFILLCAIQRARAEGKTLYVFFGDMTNAFPYTDVGRLWTDMYAAGVSGPMFDMIRMVYARMTYAVRFGDEHSLPFRSLIGLLTGDTALPTLWNIFFADYRLPPHKDDVHLNGRPVSQAEQADDNLIMSTSFPVFQSKVTMFYKWTINKRAFASGDKSRWQIYGPLPLVMPTLKMGDMVVKLVPEFKYVGIWFTSVHANVFARHYAIKASKARGTANAIFALKHRIGSLPVREGLLLYKARVDCYLTSGCELSLDTDMLVTEHVEVQHLFLRRLLGLNSHSMLAVLFTETGLMPVRIRRLLLALGRLEYMLSTDPGRVVHSALLDSVALFREGKPGWASDLAVMLKRLPTAIDVEPEDLLSVSRIDSIKKEIVRIVDADLQHDIDNLVKTHMLRNRLESGEQKSLTLVTRRLRHYLTMVAVPAHRKAMTGLLLGDHNLSVERLRYPARYREAIPRQHRLCRFCRGGVEDEVHALFDCTANLRLVELRSQFLKTLMICDPTTWDSYTKISSYDFMLKLVPSRKAVQVFAKYIFLVLSLYAETPRHFPVAFRIPG